MFVLVLLSNLCCTSCMQDAGSDSFSRCTDCLSCTIICNSRYAFKPQHCVREDRYRWLTVWYYTHSTGNSDELVKSGRIVKIKEGCSDCSNLLFSLVFWFLKCQRMLIIETKVTLQIPASLLSNKETKTQKHLIYNDMEQKSGKN